MQWCDTWCISMDIYMNENNLNVLTEYYNKLTCIGLR